MINIEKLTKILGDAGLEIRPDDENCHTVFIRGMPPSHLSAWNNYFHLSNFASDRDQTRELAGIALAEVREWRDKVLASLSGLDDTMRRLEGPRVTTGSAQRDSLKAGA